MRPARAAALLFPAMLAAFPPCARATLLASGGRARATIVVADGASIGEVTAAKELAAYLRKVSSARFRTVREAHAPRKGTRLFVGPTRFAKTLEAGLDTLRDEEWIIRSDGRDWVLVGGRPRGTLYAVYRFLEGEVGVHWWNAFEEHVPKKRELSVDPQNLHGEPAFEYRDSHVIDGERVFCARSRLNGRSTGIPARFGGRIAVGPPEQSVHNFYYYLPPRELFATHPEYFSYVAGKRIPDQGQLCLSNPAVFEIVRRKLLGAIETWRGWAGTSGPIILDVSPNDWGGWCECERCKAEIARAGTRSGQLLEFVNRLADALRPEHPGVFLTTLAYYTTFEPPPEPVRARDDVIVHFSGLQWRDFSKSILDPENRKVRDAFLGWRRAAKHLWTWDYSATIGNYHELPLPTLANAARDLRWYRDQGVEGVFVEADYPISAHLRDLKVWVLLKLLEDPRRDLDALVREFTDGYYGPAGPRIRDYLEYLEQAAGRRPARIVMEPDPWDYEYLDAEFFRTAYRIFDEAAASVRDDPARSRRVRHARLSLDRAALFLWSDLSEEAKDDPRAPALPFSKESVLDQCERTWAEQVRFRSYAGDPSARSADDVDADCRWASKHS